MGRKIRRGTRDFVFQLSENYARSATFGLSGLSAASMYSLLAKALGNSFRTRQIFDNLHAVDPLRLQRGVELPPIEVVIASTRKDFASLNVAIEGLRKYSSNPIVGVKVVVPAVDTEFAEMFTDDEIWSEEDFLPSSLRKAADRFSEIGRRGWAMQQLIGFYGAWSSKAAGVLVCDSDTVLLSPRTWLDDGGTQILSYSYEYHQPYEDHCERIWGPRIRHHGLSYVTHYMLMQPDIVKRMFPSTADMAEWVNLGDLSEQSAIADYHTYARWVVENLPNRARMARWRNLAMRSSRKTQDGYLPIRAPVVGASYLSVSMHSYLS